MNSTLWERLASLASDRRITMSVIESVAKAAYAQGVKDMASGTATSTDTPEIILERVIEAINKTAEDIEQYGVYGGVW